MIVEQDVGVAMWQGSLQTTGELDMLDHRRNLVDVPVIKSAVNEGLLQR